MQRSTTLVSVAIIALLIAGLFALPTFASLAQNPAEPMQITNDGSVNALSIIQANDVDKSRSEGGALLINNTKNDNTGLTLYSNAGVSVLQPLMRMEIDNETWDQEVLYIHSDSPTSRGLIRLDSPAPEIEFVETDQVGAGGKFEIRVQHDKFQINSRRADDTTFENKISMTHDGSLELESGIINVKGGGASQFAGGINITGGCIAIDGKCVISSANDVASLKKETTPGDSGHASQKSAMSVSKGEPDPLSCNSYKEQGTWTLDSKNNRLYVCNGPERGWDYSDLSD